MKTDLIREVVSIDDADPDAFSMHWQTIGQIHAESMLHPCAEMLTLIFAGTHHLFQFGVHFADCDKDNHKVWPENPDFIPWIKREVLSTFTEPVRAMHIYWRMPDFSLQSVICEAEGYVHDTVTIPALGKALITPFDVGDVPMTAVTALANEIWGPAWSMIPCTHHKRQTAVGEEDED